MNAIAVSPVQHVGVIGGGQLAWMLAPAAQQLGMSLHVQTPNDHDPAVAIADQTVLAAVRDAAATAKLAQACDVITFENEFVDLPALTELEETGVRFRPRPAAIASLLDKLDQRQLLTRLGLPTPRFLAIAAATATESELTALGFPVVLKQRRHGYDGKGTQVLRSLAELQQALQSYGDTPLLLEEFIPFEQELAVMVARSQSGAIATFPVVQTHQQNQVCRWVVAPAAIPGALQKAVAAIARTLVETVDYVGVAGIELFQQGDRLWVNEIAPRTHNSGHYSLDACQTSQFEQQLRAIADLPLGSTALQWPGALMVNLLGFEDHQSGYAELRQQLAALPGACLYWYGKTESKPGRKLGHITLPLSGASSTERAQQAQTMLAQVEAIWPNPDTAHQP
nr:phosphoribosyl aminoimidazole carboxylase [Synechococcus elongatus PCC 7942 = FACHB-805]prf//1909376A rbc downstream ORF 1 [Synechococcus sp.]